MLAKQCWQLGNVVRDWSSLIHREHGPTAFALSWNRPLSTRFGHSCRFAFHMSELFFARLTLGFSLTEIGARSGGGPARQIIHTGERNFPDAGLNRRRVTAMAS